MGYTHYWRQRKSITDEQWNAIVRDFVKLYGALPPHTDTAGAYHSDQPLMVERNITDDRISFNGTGPEGTDLGHEDFWLEKQPGEFSFCKTARKPYDLLVCATLIVVDAMAPGALEITSDGEPAEWMPALDFVTSVLGNGHTIPAGVS